MLINAIIMLIEVFCRDLVISSISIPRNTIKSCVYMKTVISRYEMEYIYIHIYIHIDISKSLYVN